jgi:mono/diheme cytochrome c family protein
MLRRVLRIVAVVLAFVAVVVVVLAVRAKWIIERSYAHVAEPPIAADTSKEGIARGEVLFQSLCFECHGGPDGRATGKRLAEIPAFLGTFYSANLAHPERGVKSRTDGQLARVLRSGVLPDGRLSVVMNGFGKIGDADVAAILGYMRSDPKILEPAGAEQPRTKLSLAGAMIITYVAGLRIEDKFTSVPVPPKAPTVEYGRYMAQTMDCVGCHTDGFGSDKMHEPRAFGGGFEAVDPTGTKIYTKNITFDETGIAKWSVDEFEGALIRGVTPDGYLVRKPMPLYSRLDRTDVEAIYKFLQSMPKVHRPNTPGGHPLKKAGADDPPEVLFVNLGCASCHGEKGPHRDKLLGALAKTDADIAAWILDPRATKPDTMMPSFQHAIDRTQAEKLARYVKEVAKKHGG